MNLHRLGIKSPIVPSIVLSPDGEPTPFWQILSSLVYESCGVNTTRFLLSQYGGSTQDIIQKLDSLTYLLNTQRLRVNAGQVLEGNKTVGTKQEIL